MRRVNRIEAVFHFFVDRLAEVFLGELQAGFDEVGVLFDVRLGFLSLLSMNPALALGDDLAPELLRGNVVSPLAERAFGELLNVALVDERDRLAVIFESMLDRHAHQALGPGH